MLPQQMQHAGGAAHGGSSVEEQGHHYQDREREGQVRGISEQGTAAQTAGVSNPSVSSDTGAWGAGCSGALEWRLVGKSVSRWAGHER